jgi:hypothetical protein
MSYTLDLYFEPAVRRDRMLQHFAKRRHFSVKDNTVVYGNPDTGVYFSVKLRCARTMLFQKSVPFAEFELNYHRPSYFGIEAEIELSALMARFRPRIRDPQMHGMGEGPYSREGFLSGWNFGNVFSARHGTDDIATMPARDLRGAWEWNYHRVEHDRRNPSCFIPTIMFFRIEGRPSRVIIWPQGMPALLPPVDHVLVGRLVSGEKRFGLATWSGVVEIAKRAGFDTTQNPLRLTYFVPPPSIANWVATIPLIELDALQRLSAERILDDELIDAARASTERDQGVTQIRDEAD